MSEDHLTRIETLLTELRAEMAGVAKNVEIEALTRLVRQSITDTGSLRDELRVVSAMTHQLIGAVGGVTNLLARLAEQQERTVDRVRALETRE